MIIYKVTNLVNQKVYIGQTTLTLDDRKKSHYKEAKYKKNNNRFHNALNFYKKEDFKWEILEDSIIDLEELNSKEIYYISLYDTTNKSKGYNLKLGGNNGGLNSLDTKLKIGKSTKERWQNPKIAKKMYNGLIKGTETIKQRALNNIKYGICKNCKKEFTYKKDYHIMFCSKECRIEYFKCNKGLNKANEINKKAYKDTSYIIKNKIIEWCINNKDYFINIKYNNLSNIFNALKKVSNLKDERSIMKIFGFTKRKDFIKELSKIYAVQVWIDRSSLL